MVQRTRGRGETIPRAAEVLDVMGRCRRQLVAASMEVRPFGTAYHAIHLVTTAIDTLAYYATGRPHYYEIDGTVGPSTAAPQVEGRPDDADEPA